MLTSQGNKNQENSHLANTERATNLQQPNFLKNVAPSIISETLARSKTVPKNTDPAEDHRLDQNEYAGWLVLVWCWSSLWIITAVVNQKKYFVFGEATFW